MSGGVDASTRLQPARTRRGVAPQRALAVAVLGVFMAFVDATIVNIAVPSIARDFSGSSLSSISWVLNAYNIVFAAFLVGGGQLADLLGRRRVFSLALTVFTLSSALCALAPSLDFLIAARVIQAAGASMLVPSSLAIVLEAHPERDRMHAVALWTAVAALAAGIGPALGGLLITASSWRLVFLVNVPVGVLAYILARRVIVESRSPGRRSVPDLTGAVVLAMAIASLVLAVVKGGEWGWSSAQVIGTLLMSLSLGSYFVARSSRQRTPVIDLALLRIRTFSLSNGATIVMAGGFYAYTLCNVLFLTTVWRYSVLEAGLAMTPGPVTAMAVAASASRLVHRFGHRAVVVPGALVWAAGMAYFATSLGASPDFLGGWLPGMLILGLGAGLTFPTLSSAAVGSVPGPRFAIATSLNSVARQVGAALGVAVLIAILGKPAPSGLLHRFEHGWLFAGACFLAGSLACTALTTGRATPSEEREPGADGRVRRREAVEEALIGSELPSLAESTEERALVTPQTLAGFLRNVPVFAGLSQEMREEIATLAESVSLPRDAWLFRQGEEADGVYVVRLGHVEVVTDGPEQETINTLTRGAVLGELALLNDSPRSASVRAVRDTELIRIDKASFTALLRSEPELALSLARVLGTQLQASRARPVTRRPLPVTIALCAAEPGVGLLDLADELSRALCAWGKVAVLHRAHADAPDDSEARESALARFATLVEHAEQDHDQVIMVCGPGRSPTAWDEFCISRADRVLAVVPAEAAEPSPDGRHPTPTALRGSDLLALGVRGGSGSLARWIEQLSPPGVFAISAGAERRADLARMARRLAGRSLGIVLGGGGARAFAHLGVLEELLHAGVVIDRVGGVSMGAFIGGLLACGHDGAAIDACCYEEWVRRNPINDYTLPRSSLIKGKKAKAMLERVFGDVRIEELQLPFYCASVNLRGSRLVIDSHGPLATAIGASMSLPLIGPPMRRADSLLIDGSLLDNLPLAPMSSTGEGPVLAIDIKGGEERTRPAASPESPAGPSTAAASAAGASLPRRNRIPALPETMARIALLSSANTDEAARRHADLTVSVRVSGVGLLEFHQLDHARAAGRRAAVAALENAPPWLVGERSGPAGVSGRRTVIRV
jgi:NTE family protein